MTETEIKAAEMVERFYCTIRPKQGYKFDAILRMHQKAPLDNIIIAKQCALIAVDREIQSFSNFFALHYSDTIDMDITIAFSEHIESLKALRAEIEKL